MSVLALSVLRFSLWAMGQLARWYQTKSHKFKSHMVTWGISPGAFRKIIECVKPQMAMSNEESRLVTNQVVFGCKKQGHY